TVLVKSSGMLGVVHIRSVSQQRVLRVSRAETIQHDQRTDALRVRRCVITGPLPSRRPSERDDRMHSFPFTTPIDDGANVPHCFIGSHQSGVVCCWLVHLSGTGRGSVAADVHHVNIEVSNREIFRQRAAFDRQIEGSQTGDTRPMNKEYGLGVLSFRSDNLAHEKTDSTACWNEEVLANDLRRRGSLAEGARQPEKSRKTERARCNAWSEF